MIERESDRPNSFFSTVDISSMVDIFYQLERLRLWRRAKGIRLAIASFGHGLGVRLLFGSSRLATCIMDCLFMNAFGIFSVLDRNQVARAQSGPRAVLTEIFRTEGVSHDYSIA
ncbi:hypothetical protein [Paraburkholderia sp. SIMBA_030]|uniref:hypothetical protein n=1 Tax=Paraburkholderia sp. SIMBA_030 TaxID=3085773 RepID=UPI00397A71C9